jgi:alanine-glyoxylate transaminase/serine-glyoxylate transaminase/serine-pyruvate transaminase
LLAERAWPSPTLSMDLRPWLAVMEATDRGEFAYFQSPAGNLVLALGEALRLILAEGTDVRVRRHVVCREMLHAGLRTLGIEPLPADPSLRANGVTVCHYPGVSGPAFLQAVRSAGVLLTAGTHPTVAESTFRIGHLGGVTMEDVLQTLKAVESAVDRLTARPHVPLAEVG